MSSFKNLLKSDTPTASSNSGASRGAIGGQGSHFPKSDDTPLTTPAADALGSTVTGTEPNTVGPSDTSAAPTSASQAQATAGPEAGGAGHVGTTAADSSALPGDRTGAPSSATPAAATHSFPTTLRSGPGTSSSSAAAPTGNTGTAAVGQTTTYSSRPLGSGDPTGSVVDHQSTDPLTYKLPEAGSHAGPGTAATGATPTNASANTSSVAATAASLAWSAQNKNDTMPGEYPADGNENPYRASNLDPRVDGGAASAAAAAASQPTSDLASSGPAPSTLTTTANPADRSAEYATTADNKGLESATSPDVQSQSTPVATAESGEQQSVIGRTLGAIGLGGAASAAAGYLGYGAKGDTSEEPRDTSAIATQPGAVSQETGPPKHYRRESIPTTAYPGGPNSPRAIAPPVGGTNEARQSIDQGLASGSAASNERGVGGTPATTEGVSSGTGFGLGSATSGVAKQEYDDASKVRDTIGSGDAGVAAETKKSEGEEAAKSSSKEGDANEGEVGSPGTATADAIDAGAFPLKQTNKEAELLGNVDKDPATVGGPEGTNESAATSGAADQSSSSHAGRDAAVGAAAGAAAVGAGEHALQHHERSEDLRSSAAADASREQNTGAKEETLSGGQSYTITGGQQSAPVDAISPRDPNDRSGGAPLDAVAAAPGRYDGQDYSGRSADDTQAAKDTAVGAGAAATGTGAAQDSGNKGAAYYDATTVGQSSRDTPTTATRDDHTARDAGVGAAAGAAAGGAAYAAHERSNEKDLEKQREADAKAAAKEEKHHQKEIEKQEKHQQKEMEKEQKKEQKKHEKEAAAAAAGTAGAAGATSAEEPREKEKKPSIFKRIFKRRKNKDTGEDEDYSTDDEEDKARHAAASSSVATHQSDNKEGNVLGTSRDENAGTTTGPTTGTETGTGLASETDDRPRDSITGLPYDPTKDPEAAARLAEHEGSTAGLGGATATGEGENIPGSEPMGYIGDTRR